MSIGMCYGSSKYDSDCVGAYFTIMDQSDRIESLVKTTQQWEEKEIVIRKLTGFGIDDLIQLFTVGYTLKQPEKEETNE